MGSPRDLTARWIVRADEGFEEGLLEPEFYPERSLVVIKGRNRVTIGSEGRRYVTKGRGFRLSSHSTFRGMFPTGVLPVDDPEYLLELDARFEISVVSPRSLVIPDPRQTPDWALGWQRDITKAIAYGQFWADAIMPRHPSATGVHSIAWAMNRR